MAVDIADAAEPPLDRGGEWPLLTIPYIFSQDGLLSTGDFIKQAKERGISVSLPMLEKLHKAGLLAPMYLAVDDPDDEWRVDDAGTYAAPANPRGRAFAAARDGCLRNPAVYGYQPEWPFERPGDVIDPPDGFWWNGYLYSPWQLLDLANILHEYQAINAGWRDGPHPPRQQRRRELVRVLAALSTRFLPGVLRRMSLPDLGARDGLLRYRASSQVVDLVEAAGFNPANLAAAADALLLDTSDEPLAKWLPLLRHASYAGWSKLRGEPLAAMWQRVAAEILLRAHEDLAASGVLKPLPDLTGANWHSGQHDRLTPRFAEAQTLERALAELGLSPHPKVILLVEGKTENFHVPKLLAELGIGAPQDVRVKHTKSSRINATLIARYGVTPRVGRKIGSVPGWFLDASTTCLVIAMDPENDFATAAQRDEMRRKLQEAIRDDVREQGGDISQEELDWLVHVRVWGEDSYELANFTDDELAAALTRLAEQQNVAAVTATDWDRKLRAELAAARAAHHDIKVAMGRMRIREDKPELARILWPVLRSKCELELAAGARTTPVLDLVLEVQRLVARLTGISAITGEPAGSPPTAETQAAAPA